MGRTKVYEPIEALMGVARDVFDAQLRMAVDVDSEAEHELSEQTVITIVANCLLIGSILQEHEPEWLRSVRRTLSRSPDESRRLVIDRGMARALADRYPLGGTGQC